MKDSKIVFCNKQTYEFKFEDMAKAIKFCEGKRVWAIETPYGVWQPMPQEYYDNVSDAVFSGPAVAGEGYEDKDI